MLSNSLFVRMWHTLLNHIKFGRKVTQLIQIGILNIKVRRKNESGDRESKISPKGQSHHQVEETLPAGVLVTCNQ